MTQFNAPTYDIARPTGQCAFTGRALEPGEAYMATLIEFDPAEEAPPAASPVEEEASDAGDQTERRGKPPASAAAGLGLKRLDVSMQAWQAGNRPQRMFGYWKATVPEPNQKKRLFVDDSVLMSLFHRLADTEQPQRLAFRFVLGLILMRKKLLQYEGSERRSVSPQTAAAAQGTQADEADEATAEYWLLKVRGQDERAELLNPQLDEQRIREVTEQLGEVLEAEL